ncbi:MAG: CDP-diacylglycerol--glycerol-3-phosphate 3-phosphatidyltransferase [Slackia sp.]|nr:CDP-diacylglycerol--glycerol-3-phosphate 3-phosphatidyltransferase [Slackia sp.]
MQNSVSKSTETVMTPANIITMVRICLVPVFVAAIISPWPEWIGFADLDVWKSWIAAAIFVVISCTDWLDGYLARKRNEVTDFGKFMDPLADKILVTAALLVLIELGAIPSWVVLVIVAREFIVSGVRMVAASKGEVIAASWYGKFKTVFQMVAIVLFVVKESPVWEGAPFGLYAGLYVLSWLVMGVALVLTVVSMVDYISKARHLIGFKPKGSRDGASSAEPALAVRVIDAAKERGLRIAAAESCTGGLVSAALTDVPGASESVWGGVVSYANDVKHAVLGVSEDLLSDCGAVSEQVACAMADGARAALGADIAVSVTGIAGPGGAVPGKPVGTVWVGASSAAGAHARLHHFEGDRESVRRQSVDAALQALLDEMERTE